MKLPEPIGWSYLFEDDGSLCQQFDTREEADRWVDSPDCLWSGYVSPLYSEAQVKELLAQANASRIAAQTENETLKGKLAKFGLDARRKYEPVLKMALDALYWTTPIGGKPVKQTQDAMDAIRQVLA